MRCRRIAVLGVSICLLMAACGGGDETEEPQAAASQTEAAEPTELAESSSGSFSVGVPEGWSQSPANETSELFMSNDAEPNVQLGVVAAPIASPDGLTEYVEGQRAQVEAFTNVTEVTEAASGVEVAGEPTTSFDWFFNAQTEQGKTDLVERRVIFVHGSELFDVKLQAPVDVSEEAFADLDEILGSWEFVGAEE